MHSAAVSSSSVPVTMISGIVGRSCCRMRSAASPPKAGRRKSASTRSGRNSLRAVVNSAAVMTRWVAHTSLARFSSRTMSSASATLSSTRRIRSGEVIGSGCGWWWTLVQQQPIQLHIGDRADEGLEVDRLDDVAVGPEVIAGDDVGLLVRRGEDDDGDRFRAVAGLEAPQHLQPVDLGELQVQEDDLRGIGLRAVAQEEFQRLGAVAGDE